MTSEIRYFLDYREGANIDAILATVADGGPDRRDRLRDLLQRLTGRVVLDLDAGTALLLDELHSPTLQQVEIIGGTRG